METFSTLAKYILVSGVARIFDWGLGVLGSPFVLPKIETPCDSACAN